MKERKFDGIYLGRNEPDGLIYAGKVDHGFDKASSAELRRRLTPLIRKTQPYSKHIAHKGIWVEPQLLPYPARFRCGRYQRRSQGRRTFQNVDRRWLHRSRTDFLGRCHCYALV